MQADLLIAGVETFPVKSVHKVDQSATKAVLLILKNTLICLAYRNYVYEHCSH